jgi:hypothetical protein
MSDFENAKSYRIDGCDHYHSSKACLLSWAYDAYDGGLGLIRAECPVTVNAYALAERVSLNLDFMADDMMTTFEDMYAYANLGLTDDIYKLADIVAMRACKAAIHDAIAKFEATLPVTKLAAEPVASRTYTADEVLAVLRDVKPAWFKEVG